ncbi:MAG: hypothetical protein OEM77_01235 [Nitrosopumilus sp.]|nr:hypothetical protein [Nitrosopumilus sp.]MDH3736991.1 hypothetical protein [Nitrosopumilus sp.]MDH3823946.1 hypothetical protein [Nitrosopumilus sp.]MDH3835027.1 hypothetical protein [Nitrosopumilus sp.]
MSKKRKPQQKRKLLPEKEFAILVNNFVNLIKKDPNAGKNKIKRYVMVLKQQIDDKKLNSTNVYIKNYKIGINCISILTNNLFTVISRFSFLRLANMIMP